MPIDYNNFSGPIPGENYTSDTRNYPWHRPPDHVTIDSAMEYFINMISDEEAQEAIISMLELGINVATITDLIVTKGISQGRWSIDLGILLAGPISHVVVLLGRGFDIDFKMGLDTKRGIPTSALLKEIRKENKNKENIEKDLITEQNPALNEINMGFMSMPVQTETSE